MNNSEIKTNALEKSLKKNKKTALLDIIYISIFTAMIAICSQISIPTVPVPFTLQTLCVFVAAAMLGWKRGTISVLIYILLGLIGVPVFQGFSGGIDLIFSPSFGYILGFVLTSLVIGLSTKFFGNKIIPLAASMVIGMILCYTVGTVWFMFVYSIQGNSMNLAAALGLCVFPFLIADGCKIAAAVILVNRLDKIIKL